MEQKIYLSKLVFLFRKTKLFVMIQKLKVKMISYLLVMFSKKRMELIIIWSEHSKNIFLTKKENFNFWKL